MDLHLDLDGGPRRRARLERALRDAIVQGRLPAGRRLPATRSLSEQLGVSRGVVVDAYAQLAAEGYLVTRRGGGTRVAAVALPPQTATHEPSSPPRPRYDLSPFRPALDGFPRVAWAAALNRAVRAAPDAALDYADPHGVPALRAALAAYLARARGVRADAGAVVVTCGMRHGLGALFAALRARGTSAIAVEDPGWRGAREVAADAGLRIDPGASVAVVAPAHQYPTGRVMPAAERARLLASRALIVEDDYDAEYRYDRQPVGALQGLAPDRVVYGGSTSKTLAPALRLGWLVLPDNLVEPVAETIRLRGAAPPGLQQLAFADLIERGELDRHLRRQRRRYAAARTALLAELDRHGLRVEGAAAGLFVVVRLPDGVTHVSAPELALADATGPAIPIGYANIAPASIAPAVRALAQAIERDRRAASRQSRSPKRACAGSSSPRSKASSATLAAEPPP